MFSFSDQLHINGFKFQEVSKQQEDVCLGRLGSVVAGGRDGRLGSAPLCLNLVFSPGHLPFLMLEAGPRAEPVPCKIELYKKRKGGHPYLFLLREHWEGNLPPCAQAHHAGKPWGHCPWQHSQLRDPLLWSTRAFLPVFNHFEMTWSVWCVPSRQCWARCTRRRPWHPARSSPSYQQQKQDVSC